MTPDAPESLKVFVSGTYEDLEIHRREVADVLRRTDFEALDSHGHTYGHSGILTRLFEQVSKESDAYLGLFSSRYGSLVETLPEPISYTEFEFDLAVNRWGRHKSSPIFVFRPRDGRSCESGDIGRRVERVYENLELDPVAIDRDRRAQQRFIGKVLRADEPMHVYYFCTLEELAKAVAVHLGAWQGRFLRKELDRSRRRVASLEQRLERAYGDQRLVAIGRGKHLSLAEAAHETVISGRSVHQPPPGLCLLVHGRSRHGQAAFVSWLEDQPFWQLEGRKDLRLEHSRTSAHFVWWRLWEAVGPDPEGAHDDVEALADAAARTCAYRPVFLRIENVHLLEGGIKGFREQIWTPLFPALHHAWVKDRPRHHVFIVLTAETRGALAYGVASSSWSGKAKGDGIDHAEILALPDLAAIREDDVEAWLRPRVASAGERWRLVQEVLGDGQPEKVIEALMALNLSSHSPRSMA